jgi:hypothetical protein
MPVCRPLAAILLSVFTVTLAADQKDFLGRWNLSSGGDAPAPYWLEVKEDGGKLTAKFLNRGGHPTPVDEVRVEGDELIFTFGAANQPKTEFRGKVAGGTLIGTLKRADRPAIALSGGRPPKWPAANANAAHTYGKPVVLFGGQSIDAFTTPSGAAPTGWRVEDGVLTNADKASNLVSKEKFKDFKITAEYKVGENTNSGIYLRGRYELQVLNDYGKPPFDRGHMSIYGWKAPSANAGKPGGEWQTMEAVVVGNRVTVTHNGQRVHDNAVLEAITGGALDNRELEAGPIMIQGDHTNVWFRNITVTPITKPGK